MSKYIGLLAVLAVVNAKLFEKPLKAEKKDAMMDMSTPGGACPPGWDAYFNSNACIQAVPIKKDFFEAEMSCNQMGGHLVSIHSGFENAQVLAISQTAFTQCRYWIGANRFGSQKYRRARASRLDSNLPWAWVDNTPFNYANWKPGNPDNRPGSPDCAFMDVESGAAKWANNGSCAEKNCYICERPMNGMTTPSPVQTTPNPWVTSQYPWQTTDWPWWTTQYWTDTPCPDYTTWAPPTWAPWTTWFPEAAKKGKKSNADWSSPSWDWTTPNYEWTTYNPWNPTGTPPWWLTTYNPCWGKGQQESSWSNSIKNFFGRLWSNSKKQ